MTKYTLNETPVRTSINFAINDISLDLDIPTNYTFKEPTIENNDNVDISTKIKKDYTSRIGLNLKEYQETVINIKEDINKPLIINYNVDNFQVTNIVINVSKNTTSKIIIKYTGNGYNFSKVTTNLEEYSTLDLDIINLIDI